ncbi:MAG: histone deacetylase family protein [Deltaproteobacteria bacterium]|nr:histone deacetylase family protein [Deltaproteobacteria bacterium]
MFRIRRIHDDVLPPNRTALDHAVQILRAHFPEARREEIEGLPDRLRNPFRKRFRYILVVAERRFRVVGCAVLMHEPQIGFCFLDFLAVEKGKTSYGVGGALYEAARDEARALAAKGLFFECLPDDFESCRADKSVIADNRRRLRFYERYGARPVDGTEYQLAIKPSDNCMPLLVYDGIGSEQPLSRDFARQVVRAVLERKYSKLCPPEYVDRVVASFTDDPVRLRPFRYRRIASDFQLSAPVTVKAQVALLINNRHEIHHVRERGYVESPVRISRILTELKKSGLFVIIDPEPHAVSALKTVHDSDYVEYLRRMCARLPEKQAVYPYVFPIRRRAKPPLEMALRAGYYCIDTFTPLSRNAWHAARGAADCALTGARLLVQGWRLSYALVRPPGHHAERRLFGGFCYFNNNALAAQLLSREGRVAILDLDYHHGNGQQDIFYKQNNVLTISIHGHPDFAYPYFSGFTTERGEDAGKGYNLNLPLPEKLADGQYIATLKRALGVIRDFRPTFLVVALGLDTARGDPTGNWNLDARDFAQNGRLVGELGLPTLVVQEGGYRIRTLGTNTSAFWDGLHAGNRRASPATLGRRERTAEGSPAARQ